MKWRSSSSVFESFRPLYYSNKISGYLFFTIKRTRFGGYVSTTTALDLMVFTVSLSLASYVFLQILGSPQNFSGRSIIIELALYIVIRILVLHPIIVILMNFYQRHKTFHLIEVFHDIDKKVSLT